MHEDDKGVIAQQIESWIRQNVTLQKGDHGYCNRILLRHLSVDRKVQGDVSSFSVTAGTPEDELPPLINAICEAAQKDADDLNSGIQHYALYAQFPDSLTYQPRKIFRVAAANNDFERDLAPSEPPTDKGLLSQLMRHTEAYAKTLTVSQGYVTETLRRENQRLSDLNEKYAGQQIDFMILMQSTLDRSHARRLNEAKEEVGIALKREAMNKLSPILAVIANKIAGQTVFPVTDPSFVLMGQLLENLSEEQQSILLKSLDPAQQVLLAEILGEYEKKKATEINPRPSLLSKIPFGQENNLGDFSGSNEGSGDAPQKAIAAPGQSPKTASLFRSIEERMKEQPGLLANDEIIRDMEKNAKDFADRFRERMQSTNKEKE